MAVPPATELARTLGLSSPGGVTRLRELALALDPEAPLAEQARKLVALLRFAISGPTRLEMVVVTLERVPEIRALVEATLTSLLWQTEAVKLLGEVGLPNDRGLWAETTDRLARALLPEAPRPHDLSALAARIVRKPGDLAWLGPDADDLLRRFAAVCGDAWEPLRRSALDAITLIVTRIAAMGISEGLRSRSRATSLRESPLYQLGLARPEDMPELIAAARAYLGEIHEALEDKGVSIEIVYQLDAIERGLARVEILLPFVTHSIAMPAGAIRTVISATTTGLLGMRSFRHVMADNTRLLARKIIERAGRSGEHYVTSSRKEYWSMFRSALGGGAVIVFLTAGKFLIKWAHFVPFVDAMVASAAYTGAFLVMQLLHLTLATKQPSMTAAMLADSIRSRPGPHQLDELVQVIARIARSQFAAIVGNILAVVVLALAFDRVYIAITGHPFLDAEGAQKAARSLDPIGSWTVVLAIVTGVQLWISSLFAGWFENWIVFRRIPDAIAHHRLGKRFGAARMHKAAHFLEHHAAGFGGSASLGLLFGFTPQIGGFFGLGIDGRHITITTTTLVLAADSGGISGLGTDVFVRGCLGLVAIALCNFGVSFSLALVVALRAREVPRGTRRTLPWAVLRQFARKPLAFFYPPRDPVKP